ncbi:MAG: glutathione S-transferase family protein [Pacificimonas sp.]|jgi:glutathione S-transferase|nr:glutathione S-transferase family protein [Pacificimonas sp.]
MTAIEITGSPGSPYTRKMLALLRYRRLPYRVHWTNGVMPEGYPKPRVHLLPIVYLTGPDGEREALTDSTPIIRRLEAEHPHRSVIPDDPALAFLNTLIEDYADEFVTKMMFHYRWAHKASAEVAAPLLVHWRDPLTDGEQAKAMAQVFATRQIDRLYVVGSNDRTAAIIEAAYERLLKILGTLIQRRGFVLGARASSADFALYGQLTQLAQVDPVPRDLAHDTSMRVRAWLDLMEDLSGRDPSPADWLSAEETAEALPDLLAEIGRTYTLVMIANARSINAGEKTFTAEVDGAHWEQPVFPYQAKCLGWLRDDYASLEADSRAQVDSWLSGSGCEALFADL